MSCSFCGFSWAVYMSMNMIVSVDNIDVITHDKWCDAQDNTEPCRKLIWRNYPTNLITCQYVFGSFVYKFEIWNIMIPLWKNW